MPWDDGTTASLMHATWPLLNATRKDRRRSAETLAAELKTSTDTEKRLRLDPEEKLDNEREKACTPMQKRVKRKRRWTPKRGSNERKGCAW